MTTESLPLFSQYNSAISSQEDTMEFRLQKRQQDFINNTEDFFFFLEN